jgi:two-component system response regulator VicR
MEVQNAATNKPLRILVVEDDQMQAEMLRDLFTYAGYEFLIQQSVDSIIPVVVDYKPDLVLLDYLLGPVNGGEHCSAIKKDEELKQIPVIMYSAYPKVMLSLGNYGCDLFIAKPFDIDELLGEIEKLVFSRWDEANR